MDMSALASFFATRLRWPGAAAMLVLTSGVLGALLWWVPAHAATEAAAVLATLPTDPSAAAGSQIDLVALLQLIPWLGPYLPDILSTIGLVAMIAAHLPTPTSATGGYAALWRVFSWIAQNFRYAKPAAQPPCKGAGPKAGPPSAAVALLTLVLATGALSGCADPVTLPMVQVALTGAEQSATEYVMLPPCPTARPCSDATVIAQIKAADNIAYATVKAAEVGTVTPQAAMAAVAGLSALIPAFLPTAGK
jgi:hypothetical protein